MKTILAIAGLALSLTPALAQKVVTIDRLVDHVSSVPAIAGKNIDLFVREKVPEAIHNSPTGKAAAGKVVLFVHGGYSPAKLAFDVEHRDYSWMEYLAKAGYDVFAMDMTGYGQSGRPMMDDPCNLEPRFQDQVMPRTLQTRCEPSYKFELVSSDSESADIDRVVDFIRKLRGVDKITLIGWSGGGIRTGTYTVRNPQKVEKLIIHASSNYSRGNPDDRPAAYPKPGAPATIQTRKVGVDQRWLGTQKCEGFVEPGLPEMIWHLNTQMDPLAAQWGPGGLRAPTRTYWGWNANSAKKITVPTLLMVGEQDDLMKSNLDLFEDLGAKDKAFVSIACATHFAVWEKQRRVLHKASLDWLRETRVAGRSSGMLRADENGKVGPYRAVADSSTRASR
jgi:pimeloyl-ACP methyl ester carboxylesterase